MAALTRTEVINDGNLPFFRRPKMLYDPNNELEGYISLNKQRPSMSYRKAKSTRSLERQQTIKMTVEH